MDKARRIKEKQEAADKEVAEIKEKNFEAIKARCRVDVGKKGERMDFLGRLHNERREAIQEENIIRAQEAGELLPKQIGQTQRLAEGVLRLKSKLEKVILSRWELHEEISAQKHRQVLRSQNIELKELDAQLKSTYAAKAAQVQLRERQASQNDDNYFEKQTACMQARWYNDNAFDREMAVIELENKAKYRNDIQDQLINNERLRQQRTEEYHRERKIAEEVSKVLYKENLQLARERREKIAQVQAERDAFLRAKEIWKCKEREALLDEFNRQAEVLADKMTKEKNEAGKKANDSLAKDLAMERTARRMLDGEVKRKERVDLIDELLIEEQNNELAQGLKDYAVKKGTVKRELLDDMVRQKLFVAESRAREAAVDSAFAKYLTDQYEMVMRKDKEKNHERRVKGVQYGKDLKAVREEQRALYAEELLTRQALCRQDEELELQRLKEISLERSRILYEHASNLHGFLRTGTMRPEDYEYMKTRQCNPEEP